MSIMGAGGSWEETVSGEAGAAMVCECGESCVRSNGWSGNVGSGKRLEFLEGLSLAGNGFERLGIFVEQNQA